MKNLDTYNIKHWLDERDLIVHDINALEIMSMNSFFAYSLNGIECSTIHEDLLNSLKINIMLAKKEELREIDDRLRRNGIEIITDKGEK